MDVNLIKVIYSHLHIGNCLTILGCHSHLAPYMTQISYASTAADLSNKKRYPRFFRTCASDVHQAQALAELVTHFNWRRVRTVAASLTLLKMRIVGQILLSFECRSVNLH